MQTHQNNNDDISIKELILKFENWLKFLGSKWKIIVLAALLGCGIGLVYAVTKKVIYTAELSFALEDEKGGSSGFSGAFGLASQFGIDLGGVAGGEFSGDNLLELMRSRSMITRALLTEVTINGRKQTLAEYYIDFNNLRAGWIKDKELWNIHFLPNSNLGKFTLKQDSLLKTFHYSLTKDNLLVEKKDKKLSIITIKVNSSSELFSKYFSESLTKVVSDFYRQTKTEKSARNVAVLQKQVDSVRRMLNGAITGVASSIDVSPNPNPSISMLRVPSQKKQVDVQANTAILTQLVTNLEISKMSLLQATPLIQIIDLPILPLERTKVSKLQSGITMALIFAIIAVCYVSLKEVFKTVRSS